MLWSTLAFLGQTSLYIATTCTTRPTTTWMMPQVFYYLHITTTAQSVYLKSHNKFSRYFRFKIIYNMFYHSIVLCLERKYTLIYFCQYHEWLNEKSFFVPQVVVMHRFDCSASPRSHHGCGWGEKYEFERVLDYRKLSFQGATDELFQRF